MYFKIKLVYKIPPWGGGGDESVSSLRTKRSRVHKSYYKAWFKTYDYLVKDMYINIQVSYRNIWPSCPVQRAPLNVLCKFKSWTECHSQTDTYCKVLYFRGVKFSRISELD